jgi:hypothetical protein
MSSKQEGTTPSHNPVAQRLCDLTRRYEKQRAAQVMAGEVSPNKLAEQVIMTQSAYIKQLEYAIARLKWGDSGREEEQEDVQAAGHVCPPEGEQGTGG